MNKQMQSNLDAVVVICLEVYSQLDNDQHSQRDKLLAKRDRLDCEQPAPLLPRYPDPLNFLGWFFRLRKLGKRDFHC